jgi:phosphoglycolate phosphatase-like HAD superfamily hydrolase
VRLGRHALWQEGAAFFYDERPQGAARGWEVAVGAAHHEPMPNEFNQAFASFGLEWNWDPPLYKDLLRVAGGKERILHYRMSRRPQDVAAHEHEIPQIYALKTKLYSAMVREGTLGLRPGIKRLIEEARSAGIRLAIATTTNPANVDALLQRAFAPSGESLFGVIVAGDEVVAKKPAPDVFDVALRRLGLRP